MKFCPVCGTARGGKFCGGCGFTYPAEAGAAPAAPQQAPMPPAAPAPAAYVPPVAPAPVEYAAPVPPAPAPPILPTFEPPVVAAAQVAPAPAQVQAAPEQKLLAQPFVRTPVAPSEQNVPQGLVYGTLYTPQHRCVNCGAKAEYLERCGLCL